MKTYLFFITLFFISSGSFAQNSTSTNLENEAVTPTYLPEKEETPFYFSGLANTASENQPTEKNTLAKGEVAALVIAGFVVSANVVLVVVIKQALDNLNKKTIHFTL
ncbi:MAG: hypothetical protein HYZ14_18400 [Bacteroidetes bacterium]|nr:hypothetical protein [Bacteroidota bacterium]